MTSRYQVTALPRYRVAVRCIVAALIVALAWTWPAAVQGQIPRLFPDGIMVGDVTETQAVVWTRTNGPSTVRIEYGTTAAALSQSTPPVQTAPASDYVAKIDLSGLRPATRYHYRASAEKEGQRAVTLEGTFMTAPSPAEAASVVFAWGADLSERFKPFRIFTAMQSRRPDYFLLLGDTVYAETVMATLERLRNTGPPTGEIAMTRLCLDS